MKLKQITYLLVIMIIMTGCSKESTLIYSAPTNEQIVKYVSDHELAALDSIWIEDSAIILLENSLIALYSDQHGKLHDHTLTWGSNSKDVITVGEGVPYIAIIIPVDLLDKGSKNINLKYSDGTVESRGINDKKGLLVSKIGHARVQGISISNSLGEEIYNKTR
ncbi:hypothetical protein [Paenibacillus illinoisensis]|uniref:hypothetical protein n=1 Tax=Paenibacillus illinoisensis TaxID=59845 RepID=UPI001C8E18B4|nr:hypothetical protein [Paenibacillus illinoisensis]MBY0217860.1 hypothetical protein [Paenibacillus illinoisensis]